MASRNSKGRMIYWKISYCKQLVKCSTFAKLLFTWLIPNSDDLGRMEGDPEIIKGMVFPYEDKITIRQIRDALVELADAILIIWYEVNGDYYIQFPNFGIYQKLRSDRQYKSDYPAPSDGDTTSHDKSRQGGQNLREGEVKEKGSEGEGNVPYTSIQESFNRICPSFAKIQTLSDKRKDKIKTRWAEIKTLEKFEEIFSKMEQSKFLKGDNPRNWKATLDWVVENDNNWAKVIEGQYDNKTPGKPKPPSDDPFSGWEVIG